MQLSLMKLGLFERQKSIICCYTDEEDVPADKFQLLLL